MLVSKCSINFQVWFLHRLPFPTPRSIVIQSLRVHHSSFAPLTQDSPLGSLVYPILSSAIGHFIRKPITHDFNTTAGSPHYCHTLSITRTELGTAPDLPAMFLAIAAFASLTTAFAPPTTPTWAGTFVTATRFRGVGGCLETGGVLPEEH